MRAHSFEKEPSTFFLSPSIFAEGHHTHNIAIRLMADDFTTSLDLYQYGAASFYAGYGILCWLFFKVYCRHVYFRGSYPANPRWAGAAGGKKRWTEFHDTDGPTDYMVRGAGQQPPDL